MLIKIPVDIQNQLSSPTWKTPEQTIAVVMIVLERLAVVNVFQFDLHAELSTFVSRVQLISDSLACGGRAVVYVFDKCGQGGRAGDL